MENKEAIKVIDNIREALFESSVALGVQDEYVKINGELREQLKEKDKELTMLKNEYNLLHQKDKIWKSLYPDTTIEVCDACNGEGGWGWSDEYGNGDYGVCDACEGRGFIVEKKEK